jgi:pullulanase/glycogen debranching enzyme
VDEAFLRFVQRVIEARKSQPAFRRSIFFSGELDARGTKDIAWLHPSGREMSGSDWHDQNLSSFGCIFGEGERFLCLFNASAVPTWFVLPPVKGAWKGMFDTSSADESSETPDLPWVEYMVAPHGFVLFRETPG